MGKKEDSVLSRDTGHTLKQRSTGNEGLELAERESRKNESAIVILNYKRIGV